MRRKRPSTEGLGKLPWGDDDDRAESLHALYRFAVGEAEETIGWYTKGARWEKYKSKALRGGAILATALAGIVPLLSVVYPKWLRDVSPTWASVLLAIAAAAVGWDRFFGVSKAWMRLIGCKMDLRAKLRDFRLGWQAGTATWCDSGPNCEQTQAQLALAREFTNEVSRVTIAETQRWIREFGNSLQEAEEKVVDPPDPDE